MEKRRILILCTARCSSTALRLERASFRRRPGQTAFARVLLDGTAHRPSITSAPGPHVLPCTPRECENQHRCE